jgi:hypothetical protein
MSALSVCNGPEQTDQACPLQARELWHSFVGGHGERLGRPHAIHFYHELDHDHVLGWAEHRSKMPPLYSTYVLVRSVLRLPLFQTSFAGSHVEHMVMWLYSAVFSCIQLYLKVAGGALKSSGDMHLGRSAHKGLYWSALAQTDPHPRFPAVLGSLQRTGANQMAGWKEGASGFIVWECRQ